MPAILRINCYIASDTGQSHYLNSDQLLPTPGNYITLIQTKTSQDTVSHGCIYLHINLNSSIHTPLAVVQLSVNKDYQHKAHLLCCQMPKYVKIQY